MCAVQRGTVSLDEWARSDSARLAQAPKNVPTLHRVQWLGRVKSRHKLPEGTPTMKLSLYKTTTPFTQATDHVAIYESKYTRYKTSIPSRHNFADGLIYSISTDFERNSQ